MTGNLAMAQNGELVGLQLARPPSTFTKAKPQNFGTKLTFFVNDTAVVTGLTTSYTIKKWATDTGVDLKKEHQKMAADTVLEDYRMARDTALLSNRGFYHENGQGFSVKLHSWALPDSLAASMSIHAEIEYTVMEPGEVLIEDITHLAGNFGFETMTMDFKGNAIALRKAVYGRGENAYTTFSGTVTNQAYEFAIQNMQFLDGEGNVLDELYFGLNNAYETRTTKRVDLLGTAILRMRYRKLKVKRAAVETTFGMGF